MEAVRRINQSCQIIYRPSVYFQYHATEHSKQES